MNVQHRISVTDEERRRIRHARGGSGLASRNEVRAHADELFRNWLAKLPAAPTRTPRKAGPPDLPLPKNPPADGCRHRSPDGDVCRLPAGHSSEHKAQRTGRGKHPAGRITWATSGARVWYE